MGCEKYKKGISDLLDDRLSEKQKARLEHHLSTCSSCREYKNELMAISRGYSKGPVYEIQEEYALDFSRRLKTKLLDQKRTTKGVSGFEKWAYAAAGFVLVLCLTAYFVLFQPTSIQTEEYFVLSYEDALGNIYGVLDNDPELEDTFNSILASSINQALHELDEKMVPFIIENSLYRDEFSEEDLKAFESKIKLKKDLII